MSSVDTADTRRPVIVQVRRSHMHWGIAAFVLVLGICVATGIFAYRHRGDVLMVNGKPIIQIPNLDSLKGAVRFETPEGNVVEKVVLPEPSAPVRNPNGASTTTKDGFGQEGLLQREVVRTERFDPIARTQSEIGTLTEQVGKLADAVNTTNGSVGALGNRVQAITDQVSTMNGSVSGLTQKVDGALGRITMLETKPAASAPTSLPVPQALPTPALPAPRTVFPAAPLPQAKPIGPQSQAEPTTRLAQAASDKPVQFDGTAIPKTWHVTGVEPGNADQTCTKAMGMELRARSKWEWRNGRKFFPNDCVPIGTPRND